MRASLPGTQSLWAPHSSQTQQAVELLVNRAGSSHDQPVVSFRAPPADQMSIAASEAEPESGDEVSAVLYPSGRVALPEPDPELIAMLSQAAERELGSSGTLHRVQNP